MTTLSGQPEAGVVVEAAKLSTKDVAGLPSSEKIIGAAAATAQEPKCNTVVPVERAKTDQVGKFRVLGLQPGCVYALTLRKSGGADRRTVPERILVRTPNADVKDLHFYRMPEVVMGSVS